MPKELDLFRFRDDLKYIVIDTETESLNLHYSRPWQISWIVVENRKVVKEFDLFPLIKDLQVTAGAAQVTRFTMESYLRKATPAEEVNEQLNKYLYNPEYMVLMMNGLYFDIYQLNNFRRYLNLPTDYSYLNRLLELKAFGRAWKLGHPLYSSVEERLSWQYKICSIKQKGLRVSLEAMAKGLGLEYNADAAHDGLWDVKLTNMVFEKFYKTLDLF